MYARAQSTKLGPWYKGVYYNLPPELIDPEGLSEGENFQVGPGGELEKRPGYDLYLASSSIGAGIQLTMVAEFSISAATTYVVICGGTAMYYYAAGWQAITGSTTITADKPFEWVDANNTLVMCNGYDAEPLQWDGTGTATELDVDNRFDKAKHLAYWDNRLWFGNVDGNANRVWYSDPGDWETYGATSFYNVGEPITGMSALDDRLTIHTKNAIWTITPTSNTQIPYELKQHKSRGTLAGRCIASLPGNRLLFPLRDGIYRWDGSNEDTLEKVSYQLDGGYWPNLGQLHLDDAFCVYYPAKNQVWFSLPYGSSSAMNHIMVYEEYEHPSEGETYRWVGPWKAPGVAFDRGCVALVDGKPHYGSTNGNLYNHDSGDDDVNVAVSFWADTAAVAPESSEGEEIFRWLFGRLAFTGTGDYQLSVSQIGEDLTGATKGMNMKGDGFVLGNVTATSGDRLDQTRLLNKTIIFTDMTLNGYSSKMFLKFAIAGLSQPVTIWSAFLHHRSIGRKRRRNVRT